MRKTGFFFFYFGLGKTNETSNVWVRMYDVILKSFRNDILRTITSMKYGDQVQW